MSVIVSGMEKPKDCHDCPFVTFKSLFYGSSIGGTFTCSRLKETIGESTYKKCPIKPFDEEGADNEQP